MLVFNCCLLFDVSVWFVSIEILNFPPLPAGILFSTLVFGPACGFILGSVCTKVYVDAVFIDTSESATSVGVPRGCRRPAAVVVMNDTRFPLR